MSSSTPVIHLDSRLPALLSLVVRPVAVTLGRHVFIRRGVDTTDVLLRHLRGVGSVRIVAAGVDHLMAKEQARLQLWEQVSAVFWRRP